MKDEELLLAIWKVMSKDPEFMKNRKKPISPAIAFTCEKCGNIRGAAGTVQIPLNLVINLRVQAQDGDVDHVLKSSKSTE